MEPIIDTNTNNETSKGRVYFVEYNDTVNNINKCFTSYSESYDTVVLTFTNYFKSNVKNFNEKYLHISPTCKNTMKKFVFTWENKLSGFQTDFVKAKDRIEAKQLAILIMNFMNHNNRYTEYDIISLVEITDDDIFYTKEEIEETFRANNMQFVLPEVDEYEVVSNG